jgi:hypothetical protein
MVNSEQGLRSVLRPRNQVDLVSCHESFQRADQMFP